MKLYVPNPQNWVKFFERVSTGQTRLSQTGTGRRRRVITLDQQQPVAVKAVLPAEQTTAQAKSELEREGINPKEIVKAIQSTTRRGTKRKSTSSKSNKSKTTNKGGKKSTSSKSNKGKTTNKGGRKREEVHQFFKSK